MAGGEGTRLRPLTCTLPKPLAPLCAKPVAAYILELLGRHGFAEATFTLRYHGDMIEKYFEESYGGISLSYSTEEQAGTAGSVKKAIENLFNADKIKKSDAEPVLVISGDALCDFDLTAAMDFHKQSGGAATIIVKKVADPREFGLVLSGEGGRIRSFLEKPSFEGCVTDLANTGVYILSPEALALIPSGETTDFAQDIFPAMLSKCLPIFAYEESGYWCDVGDFDSYIRCQRDMLAGRVDCTLDGHKTLEGNIINTVGEQSGVKITAPVFIGRNTRIAAGVVIDAGSVIGDDVTICAGAKIHGGIILSGAYIGEHATVNEAIICENARLLSAAAVYEGAVIGEGAVVCENATVESGVKLWAGKTLSANTTAAYDIKYGRARQLCIDEEGICGETNGEITPQVAAVLGASLATVGDVVVGHGATAPAKALSLALLSGAMSAGGGVWDIGECIDTELDFAAKCIGTKLSCHVEAGVTAKLKVTGECGLPLSRAEERKLEAGLNRAEYGKASFSQFGNITDGGALKALYRAKLSRLIGGRLKGLRIDVTSPNARVVELLQGLLIPINDKSGERIVFHVSGDGRKISAFSEATGYVFYEKLLLLCVQSYCQRGEDVALPYSAPAVCDKLAARYAGRVLRYFSCPTDKSDAAARALGAEVTFARDGIFMLLTLVESLRARKLSLGDAVGELPEFTAANRFVSIAGAPSEILKRFCSESGGLSEGVVIGNDEGRVLIRPVKTGKGVMLFAESFKTESAGELCDFYEKMLNK